MYNRFIFKIDVSRTTYNKARTGCRRARIILLLLTVFLFKFRPVRGLPDAVGRIYTPLAVAADDDDIVLPSSYVYGIRVRFLGELRSNLFYVILGLIYKIQHVHANCTHRLVTLISVII